ncbi:MAG: UDP-glucose/GDP-mannose dehydrogenase family protein [Paludibacteraceae bacterium]|nr:UDP-glucose/GDP-mannose dehydrogenase family protein [Paludibacteraceae bacterium]
MNIAVVGTGYVGLVTGTCFAEMGSCVTCIDVDAAKISQLQAGGIPIYEPGLQEMVRRNSAEGRLRFSTSLAEVIHEVEIVFCAVGTPQREDGSANLDYVLSVACEFGSLITKPTLFATKSTVPVGTCHLIRQTIEAELKKRGVKVDFDLASNPEFLKEGDAIKDFMSPDRVVVGVDSERARELMAKLYRPFLLNNFRVIFMDVASAEMTKHAANAMLATRISFMNDMANLCERVGADINAVRRGIGTDLRIGGKFLYAGCGYGGSCFPKDVRALSQVGRALGHPLRVLEAVDAVNEDQKHVLAAKVQKHLGQLEGKHIAVLGLAFKPNTDDIREAPSLTLIDDLLAAGASVKAFDPVVKKTTRAIAYADDLYDAVKDADAMVLVTEWKAFRMPDWKRIRNLMQTPVIIDGRNIYDASELREAGFIYEGIG